MFVVAASPVLAKVSSMRSELAKLTCGQVPGLSIGAGQTWAARPVASFENGCCAVAQACSRGLWVSCIPLEFPCRAGLGDFTGKGQNLPRCLCLDACFCVWGGGDGGGGGISYHINWWPVPKSPVVAPVEGPNRAPGPGLCCITGYLLSKWFIDCGVLSAPSALWFSKPPFVGRNGSSDVHGSCLGLFVDNGTRQPHIMSSAGALPTLHH